MRPNEDCTSVMFKGTGNSLIDSRYFFARPYVIKLDNSFNQIQIFWG